MFDGNISIFDGEIPTSPQHFRPTPCLRLRPRAVGGRGPRGPTTLRCQGGHSAPGVPGQVGARRLVEKPGFCTQQIPVMVCKVFVMELKLSFEALQLSETGRNTGRPSVSVLFFWGGLGT